MASTGRNTPAISDRRRSRVQRSRPAQNGLAGTGGRLVIDAFFMGVTKIRSVITTDLAPASVMNASTSSVTRMSSRMSGPVLQRPASKVGRLGVVVLHDNGRQVGRRAVFVRACSVTVATGQPRNPFLAFFRLIFCGRARSLPPSGRARDRRTPLPTPGRAFRGRLAGVSSCA